MSQPKVIASKGKDVWKWVKLGQRAAAATEKAIGSSEPSMPHLKPLNPAPFERDSTSSQSSVPAAGGVSESTAETMPALPAAPAPAVKAQPDPENTGRPVAVSPPDLEHMDAVASAPQHLGAKVPLLKAHALRHSSAQSTPERMSHVAKVVREGPVRGSQRSSSSLGSVPARKTPPTPRVLASRSKQAVLTERHHANLPSQAMISAQQSLKIAHHNHTGAGDMPEDNLWLMMRDVGVVGGGIILLMGIIFCIVKWKQSKDAEETQQQKPRTSDRDLGSYEPIKDKPPQPSVDPAAVASLALQVQRLHERLRIVEDDGQNTRRRVEDMQIKLDEVYDFVGGRRRRDSEEGSAGGEVSGLYSFVRTKEEREQSRTDKPMDSNIQRWSQVTDRSTHSKERGRPVRF